MFARYRFAALAAMSCAGLAGSFGFAQESARKYVNPSTGKTYAIQSVELVAADGEAGAEPVAPEVVQSSEAATDSAEPAGLWLGVQLANEIPPALAHHLKDAKGALVETVYPDSPAAESGIEAYDLIVRVGEADVDSPAKLIEAMKEVEAGSVDVAVIRGGERKTISVTPRERATAQPQNTATAEATELFLYNNLNVPHIRVLPALGGPDAGVIRHRLVQSMASAANLPENVESMKIQTERDGDKVVHRVEVTTVDGKVFKAANEEELKALPPEIRAILPLPQYATTFALRLAGAEGAPAVQKNVIVRTTQGAVPSTLIPAPSPAPVASVPWVDVPQQHPLPGNVTYRVLQAAPQGEEMNQLKKDLSELRASVERIEKLLRKDE